MMTNQSGEDKAMIVFQLMSAFWPQLSRDYPTELKIDQLCRAWAPLIACYPVNMLIESVQYHATQGHEFPPITKVIHRCKQQHDAKFGFSNSLNKESVFIECCAAVGSLEKHTFSHPVIRLIYGYAGGKACFSQTKKAAWPSFIQAFERCVRQWPTRQAAQSELERRDSIPALTHEPRKPTQQEIDQARAVFTDAGIDPDDPKAMGRYMMAELRSKFLLH